MNRHERRAAKAQDKVKEKSVRTAQDKPARIVSLQASILKHTLDGRFLEALSGCREALALDPENAGTLHLMGAVHLEAGENELAVEWASRAIARQPKAEFFSTLGFALSRLGRHAEAVQALEQAVRIKADHAPLWHQLGNAFLALGNSQEALRCFAQTFELDPRHAEAAYFCGHLCNGMRRREDALLWLDKSIALRPDHAVTLVVRSAVLRELKRFDEALADAMRAAALAPGDTEMAKGLGAILQDLGRFEEALPIYERALAVRPADKWLIMNRASALVWLGRMTEAMNAFRLALSIDPDFAEAHWNVGALRLLNGDLENGWAGLEMRWKIPELEPSYPKLRGEMWLGKQPIAGKTILVCADQGMGDSIQYARYVPMLAARGARVMLAVEPALCPLLSGIEGVWQCLPKLPDTVLPPYDHHCAINSLPMAFGTGRDSIPNQPYLPRPAEGRLQSWEGRLGPHDRLRIGLVWSGNPEHRHDRMRSIPLATLSRILDADATFVSLQKSVRPSDSEALRAAPQIVDLTADLNDFVDTAALVSCLDLVIAVDTSVAHLAAALGKPTWLLLPFVPDYRWMLDRDDSPWYPCVRLFRQGVACEYESVLDRLRAELSKLAAAFAPL
jgi:tetratricopeptide (TPR) repeat protein